MRKSESEVAQWCLTLCDPMECSLLPSSVHGIFQARVLEWGAIAFCRGSSWPRDWTQVSRTVGRQFTLWAPGKSVDEEVEPKEMEGTNQVALVVKNPLANAGDVRDAGLIPGSGRSPGGGPGNPFQYSCLENPMDRGTWWATVPGVMESRTWLKWLSTHTGDQSTQGMEGRRGTLVSWPRDRILPITRTCPLAARTLIGMSSLTV